MRFNEKCNVLYFSSFYNSISSPSTGLPPVDGRRSPTSPSPALSLSARSSVQPPQVLFNEHKSIEIPVSFHVNIFSWIFQGPQKIPTSMDKPNTNSAFSRTSPNVQFTHPSSHRPASPSQTQNSLTRASPLHLSHHSTSSSSALPGASTPNTGIFKRQSHMTPPPTSSSPLYTDKRYFKMNNIFKLQITKYSINFSIRAVRWIKYIHHQHNRHHNNLHSKLRRNHEAVHRHLFCDIHNQCHCRWLVKVQFHRQCYCSPIHHTRRIDIHRIYFTRRVHSTLRIHIIHMDHLSNIWNLQQLVLAWIKLSFHIIQVKQHDTKIHHHIPTNNLQIFYKWKTKWNRQHQKLLKGNYLLAQSIFDIRKKKND